MASSGLRAGLLQEILAMARRHAARQQAALGADHPRRRHRRDVDRQHDRADPRLRRVAQGPVPADRARTRCSSTKFSFVSFSQGKEFRDLIKRPEPDRRGREGDRALAARRDGGGAAGRRPGHAPGALHLRQQGHQADGRSSAPARTSARPTRSRSSPGASSPRPKSDRRRHVDRARQRARRGAVPRRRSDRQADAHRPRRSTRSSASSASGRTRSAAARPTSSRSSRTRPGRRSTAPTRCASSASSTATCSIIVDPARGRAA